MAQLAEHVKGHSLTLAQGRIITLGAMATRQDASLDLKRELEVVDTHDGGAAVVIPLAEPSGMWSNHFPALARAEGIGAEVREEPGGRVLQVRVPAGATRDETFRLLDAAVALIQRAKAEELKSQKTSLSAEEHIREWWSALTG